MADKSNILLKEIRDAAGDKIGGISGDLIKIGADSVTDLLTGLQTTLNAFLKGEADGGDLDRLIELVAAISANKDSIDALVADKVAKADIVNALTSEDAAKVLSAAQGKALKDLVDALTASLEEVSGDAGKVSLAVINDGDPMPTNLKDGGLIMVLGAVA